MIELEKEKATNKFLVEDEASEEIELRQSASNQTNSQRLSRLNFNGSCATLKQSMQMNYNPQGLEMKKKRRSVANGLTVFSQTKKDETNSDQAYLFKKKTENLSTVPNLRVMLPRSKIHSRETSASKQCGTSPSRRIELSNLESKRSQVKSDHFADVNLETFESNRNLTEMNGNGLLFRLEDNTMNIASCSNLSRKEPISSRDYCLESADKENMNGFGSRFHQKSCSRSKEKEHTDTRLDCSSFNDMLKKKLQVLEEKLNVKREK